MWFLFILLAALVVCAIVIYFRSRAAEQPILINTAPAADVIPVHPPVDPPSNPITAPMENVSLPINQIRLALGNPPRKFSKAMRRYLHIHPLVWVSGFERDRQKICRAQKRVRRDGRIVWCAIVQTSGDVFSPGAHDHGASAVWSEDAYFDTHVDELQRIARECYELKGVDQIEPDAQRFSQVITNELIHAMRLPAPRHITGGREVFHSVLMIVRKHLPMGHVIESIMPVWVDPQPTGIIILVPAGYWPPTLIEAWKTN